MLKNAAVIDPVNETIVVKNVEVEGKAGEVDLKGKFLLPGMYDMHVHSHGNPGPGGAYQHLGVGGAAKAMSRVGVVGFLDLFSPEDEIFAIRDNQRVVKDGKADIYAAGPILTCTKGHGTEYGVPTRTIDNPAQAKQVVADLLKRKPDVVKIVYDHARKMPSMDKATMQAAIAAAGTTKTVVHIGTWEDAREAVLAGASAVTHLYEKPIPDDLVALLKARGTYMIPTMAVQHDLFAISRDPKILEDKLLGLCASENLLANYRDPSRYSKASKEWLKWQSAGEAAYLETLGKLARAGVKTMAGTDAGNIGTFHGCSLHRELEHMVRGGYSIWQTLRAATVVPEAFLGVKSGSWVVLEASPVEDIRNTKKVHAVYHHGKRLQ